VIDTAVAISPTNIWVAASQRSGAAVLHFNGKVWRSVPLGLLATGLGALTDDGSGGLWAATLYSPTRIWHYQAGHWTKVIAASSATNPYLAWMFHIPATRSTLAVGNENGPAVLAFGQP
jgi:hypothetical protein